MDDKFDVTLESHATGVEDVLQTKDALRHDNKAEHELTVKQVLKSHPILVWWIFYWAMAGVSWGFDAQANGAMIGVESFRRDFGYYRSSDQKYILPADWQSAFNTIGSVGQFFGGFICAWTADRIGRRPSLLIGLIIAAAGVTGQVLCTAKVAFLVSKLILGIGLGFYLTLAPLVSSELSPVVFRGIASAGVQFGIGSGQLIANGAVAGFGEWTSRWAYRAPFAFQLFFPAFFLIFLPFAPESPWYLARRGKREEAKKSLCRLFGSGIDADAKLLALEATIAEEEAAKSNSSTLVNCFKGTNSIRSIISMYIFCCQHFVGIIFVLGFSSYFFQLAGLPTGSSFNMGVGVTACGLAGNIVSWFTVNSLGRRKLFLGGMGILTTILLLIGILDLVHTGGAKWAQAALTVIYAFFYFLSLGAMAFTILSETSSTTLRAQSIALATATQAVMGTAFNFAIPYMINPDEGNLKGKVGFVFGGLGLLASIGSYFLIPELKDRTFDEIDAMFQRRIQPRKMGSYKFE
ncbi:maltose permease [Cordyceps militaris CM01]|uniref:Maltose permease n=1 Tax=Cordyceps militaris (strain CM01) TaxID=983644 RepID=G3JQ86_CORMM|nr:maltose permease [Cordyceps militaris CM01]EGX89337.1 maltose permease [Cordyceps militaris CM01]